MSGYSDSSEGREEEFESMQALHIVQYDYLDDDFAPLESTEKDWLQEKSSSETATAVSSTAQLSHKTTSTPHVRPSAMKRPSKELAAMFNHVLAPSIEKYMLSILGASSVSIYQQAGTSVVKVNTKRPEMVDAKHSCFNGIEVRVYHGYPAYLQDPLQPRYATHGSVSPGYSIGGTETAGSFGLYVEMDSRNTLTGQPIEEFRNLLETERSHLG